MRVNIIVTPPDLPWIGGRLARELAARLPQYGIEATINGPHADLEYQQFVYGPPTRHPSVGVFTHGQVRPSMFGPLYDGAIAFNPAMIGYLQEAGAKHPCKIELPVRSDFHPTKRYVFGVAGRTYADGRKGEHLVAKMISAGYDVRAWGSGWPCPIVSDKMEDLLSFYRSLDFYVDTSSDEGGCVPALEAIALGIPVISHTVGVEHPVIPYRTHDWPSLKNVLRRLTEPRTYDDWAREHAAYFARWA
jgi:glycosyltransferase involved in cell wall biosynthesis